MASQGIDSDFYNLQGNAQSQSVISALRGSVTGILSTATAVNNLLDPTGASSTDVRGYNSAVLTVVNAGAAPATLTFRGAANPAMSLGLINGLMGVDALLLPAALALLPTVTVTNGTTRVFKLDLSTDDYITVTMAASVAGVTCSITPSQQLVPTALTGGGNVGLVASDQFATLSAVITDIASAAITATANSASFSPTWGVSQLFGITVGTVTGTTPTLDVAIQESPDGLGVVWNTVYTFPTITASGTFFSPLIAQAGKAYRYVQTLGGTTPSFTRSIFRLQSNVVVATYPGVSRLPSTPFALTTANTPVSVGARLIRKINLRNGSAVPVFLQFHNSAAPLVSGTSVPVCGEVYNAPATNGFIYLNSQDFGPNGATYGGNTQVALSSTQNVFTALTNPQLALCVLNIEITNG